jgi:hypothetical protein
MFPFRNAAVMIDVVLRYWPLCVAAALLLYPLLCELWHMSALDWASSCQVANADMVCFICDMCLFRNAAVTDDMVLGCWPLGMAAAVLRHPLLCECLHWLKFQAVSLPMQRWFAPHLICMHSQMQL